MIIHHQYTLLQTPQTLTQHNMRQFHTVKVTKSQLLQLSSSFYAGNQDEDATPRKQGELQEGNMPNN